MRKLPFYVLIFDTDDEPISSCQFPTESAARIRYNKAIVSAACANVGRIRLTHILFPRVDVIEEWVAFKEPDVQTAGYIVHSARTLGGVTSCAPVNKTFHETYDVAERQARQLADKWSDGHEGLIIFKAIKHVQKVERKATTTRIQVRDV